MHSGKFLNIVTWSRIGKWILYWESFWMKVLIAFKLKEIEKLQALNHKCGDYPGFACWKGFNYGNYLRKGSQVFVAKNVMFTPQ